MSISILNAASALIGLLMAHASRRWPMPHVAGLERTIMRYPTDLLCSCAESLLRVGLLPQVK